MKRIVALVLVLAFVAAGLAALVSGESTDVRSHAAQGADLVALLPDVDGVATFDVKRFFNDALPTVLAKNQPVLAKITAKVEEARTKTGIDVRQFETVVAGVNAVQKTGAKGFDVDPVVIARGKLSSGAIIGAAKLSAKGKHREERVGDRTIYIFPAKSIAAQNSPNGTPAAVNRAVEKIPSEMAIAAYDSVTVVFGEVGLVRKTLEGTTHVSGDITSLLPTVPAIASLAARVPSGVGSFVPMENDELGKNIDSIRYIFGHMDMGDGNAIVRMTARTTQASSAQGLMDTLEGLQLIGKAILGSAKTPDKQVFARLVNNVKFSLSGTDVSLDLQIPQSDIDILVGSIK